MVRLSMVISPQILALPQITLFFFLPSFHQKDGTSFWMQDELHGCPGFGWDIRRGMQTAHGKLRNESVITSIPIPWHSNTPLTFPSSPAVSPYTVCATCTRHWLRQILPKSSPVWVLIGSTSATAFTVFTRSLAPFWPTQKASTNITSLTALITTNSLLNTLKLFPSLHTYS